MFWITGPSGYERLKSLIEVDPVYSNIILAWITYLFHGFIIKQDVIDLQ